MRLSISNYHLSMQIEVPFYNRIQIRLRHITAVDIYIVYHTRTRASVRHSRIFLLISGVIVERERDREREREREKDMYI